MLQSIVRLHGRRVFIVAALAVVGAFGLASDAAAQPAEPEQKFYVEQRRLGFEWQSDYDLRAAVCSPDGRMIAFGGSQQVGVWNAKTGAASGAYQARGTNHFYSLAWGANNSLYAAGQGRDIYRWNTATNELAQTYSKHSASVQRISLSADGSRLASSSSDNVVVVWKMPEGTIVRTFTITAPNPAAVHMGAIALSPDGKTLVTPSPRKKAFEVYDVDSGEPRTIDYESTAFARQCLFTPDGKRLLIRDAERLTVYDLAAGRVVPQLTRELPVYFGDMAVSPDGKLLAMVGHVRVEISSLETGKTLHQIPGPGGTLDGVAFSGDGTTIFAGGFRKTIFRWETATGRLIESKTVPRGAVGAVVWPRPEQVITASEDRGIRFWDVSSGEVSKMVEMPADIAPLRFTPDGRKLLAWNQTNLHVVDTASGVSAALEASSEWNQQPALSTDGKWVAYVKTQDRTPHEIRIAAADGKSPPRTLATSERKIHALAFSADGARLAVGLEQTMRDLGPGEAVLDRAALDRITNASDPNRRRVFDAEPTVMIYDVASGRVLEQFGEELHGVYRLEFSPSSRHLAIGSAEYEVYVRDLERQLMLPGSDRGNADGTQMTFSPDERCLLMITRSSFGIFDVETLTPIALFRGSAETLSVAAAYSPDGTRIACGYRDSRTLVWGMASATPLPRDFNAVWFKLGALQAREAEDAYRELVEAGDDGVAFLREKLKPIPPVDLEDVAVRLAQLDSNKFAVRDAADKELRRTAYLIEGELRKHLAATKSYEVRRRLSVLLDSLHADPERLRALRSTYALGAIGTPKAVETLGKLASGEPRDRITRNAQAMLKRRASN